MKPLCTRQGYMFYDQSEGRSQITFRFQNTTANAKSVLSVLGACVKSGDEIELICNGEDEQEAMDFLVKEINSGLGE